MKKPKDYDSPVGEIRLANEDVKRARRDAVTLSRLSRNYSAHEESIDLFTIIDKARVDASVRVVNKIFDLGHEYCVTHAEEILDSLR